MKYLLFTLLLFWACSRKEPPQKEKDYSLVKLFIKPRSTISESQREHDLSILRQRIAMATTYHSIAVKRGKEGDHIELKVYNKEDKRQFLRTIAPLVTHMGVIEVRHLSRWKELLKKKRPAPIHTIERKEHTLFRSVNKTILLDFLADYASEVVLQRVPKGVYDFSNPYWIAHRTGDRIEYTHSPESPLIITLSQKIGEKYVAVMLDSYILQLVKGPTLSVTLSDDVGRLTKTQLRSIMAHSRLNASWRIARIEAIQTL